MLGDGLVHPVLIVGAISDEGCDRISDLVEQHTSQRAVIDLFLAKFDRDDLAALRFDADVQLTPGSAARRAVLFNQPSPAPPSFRPVLSTSKCSGPVPERRSGGISSVLLRRLSVEWSGTVRSSPRRAMTEPMSPSVCRNARRKTARMVSAVLIARAE